MINIILLIALNLMGALHAAAAPEGGVPEQLTNREKAINQLCFYARNLPRVNEGMHELSRMGKLFEGRKSSGLESLQPLLASLPKDMRERCISFYHGITRRVSHSFDPLLDKLANDYSNIRRVLVADCSTSDQTTYVCFPEPLSTSSVVKGREQEACDLVTKFLNSYEQLQKASALLFGLGNIDRDHLIMFLTGTERFSANGETRDANKAILSLYAAYANPQTDFETVRALEIAAVPFLIRDSKLTTTYRRLTYITGENYPKIDSTTEALDKAAILRILENSDPAAQIAKAFAVFNAHLATIADEKQRQAEAGMAISSVTAGLAAMGITLPAD